MRRCAHKATTRPLSPTKHAVWCPYDHPKIREFSVNNENAFINGLKDIALKSGIDGNNSAASNDALKLTRRGGKVFLDYIQIMPQTVSLYTAKKNVKLQEQLMSINL